MDTAGTARRGDDEAPATAADQINLGQNLRAKRSERRDIQVADGAGCGCLRGERNIVRSGRTEREVEKRESNRHAATLAPSRAPYLKPITSPPVPSRLCLTRKRD